MLTKPPSKAMINEWKDIYNIYKNKVVPNKKAGIEIVNYLQKMYSTIEITDEYLEKVVYDNILLNDYSKNKLKGKKVIIRLFEIKDKELYLMQDDIFKGSKIIVGIELNTSYIFVEGSSYLYDELIAFTGLDEKDIKNYFLVAQYVKCKEKYKM